MTIIYRDATLADGPALDAMARASWIETFAHNYNQADLNAYLAEAYGPDGWLIADLARPEIRFRLAEADGGIAGYAKVAPLTLPAPDPEPGAWQLSQLYVLSAWHGKGIAQVLMDWAIATARQHGAPALYLTVWEENPRARAFYARYGFEHVGDYGYPVGETIDRDLIMKLAL